MQGLQPYWRDAQFCRYSDYYISGCKLFAKDVSASFLMSFVACGRPFPVTQHPSNPLPLSGQPCTAQSPCCGGAGRHDSHYVCVKFKGGYFPCPAREQPDYDEIVAFNPNAVLPVAAFEFKRRRRTLLWLDDQPQNNFSMLRTFPGCPQQSLALQVQAYPMQQHCTACSHGLSMDPNPNATAKQCERALEAAQAELDRVHAAARAGHAVAQERLQECTDAMQLAEAALTCAKAAAAAVVGEFAGRDISMEEQTDVVLFTSVGDMTRFLQSHPELSKCPTPPSFPLTFVRACMGRVGEVDWLRLQCRYPPSLLRMISSRKLMQEGGLLHFFDTDVTWRHKCARGGSERLGCVCSSSSQTAHDSRPFPAGTLQPSCFTPTLQPIRPACAADPTSTFRRSSRRCKRLPRSSRSRCAAAVLPCSSLQRF